MNNRVLYQIKTLEAIILRKFLTDNEFNKNMPSECSKPTPTQMQILEYILEHENEEIYQKDLEDVLNLRRATVSGVLQTMEKNNLIERVTDLVDTRTKKIILNSKARMVFIERKKRIEQVEKIIINGISQEDLETFSRVIKMMKENVKKKC